MFKRASPYPRPCNSRLDGLDRFINIQQRRFYLASSRANLQFANRGRLASKYRGQKMAFFAFARSLARSLHFQLSSEDAFFPIAALTLAVESWGERAKAGERLDREGAGGSCDECKHICPRSRCRIIRVSFNRCQMMYTT